MLTIGLLYFNLALGGVAALTAMILRVSALVGECPEARARAHVVAVSIATGFAAIGGGGVLLIGAALPMMVDAPFAGLMLSLGFAALCLGLGFTHAMGMLRAALAPAPAPAPKPRLDRKRADTKARGGTTCRPATSKHQSRHSAAGIPRQGRTKKRQHTTSEGVTDGIFSGRKHCLCRVFQIFWTRDPPRILVVFPV
ncbi:hypothetical protein ACERZ8_10300 [Tateyamaria armeniaca]|uniref:Uncharacterized protein n=1 Tax=Tateyamaria armeniaca TaxID=2518930 RepID=A0ABW8UWC4_9RHOB